MWFDQLLTKNGQVTQYILSDLSSFTHNIVKTRIQDSKILWIIDWSPTNPEMQNSRIKEIIKRSEE